MENTVCLSALSPGQQATVTALQTTGSMHRRLLDIGLCSGTKIECVGRSPSGDPSAYLIRGAVLALRREDCDKIFVENML